MIIEIYVFNLVLSIYSWNLFLEFVVHIKLIKDYHYKPIIICV